MTEQEKQELIDAVKKEAKQLKEPELDFAKLYDIANKKLQATDKVMGLIFTTVFEKLIFHVEHDIATTRDKINNAKDATPYIDILSKLFVLEDVIYRLSFFAKEKIQIKSPVYLQSQQATQDLIDSFDDVNSQGVLWKYNIVFQYIGEHIDYYESILNADDLQYEFVAIEMLEYFYLKNIIKGFVYNG